MNKIKIRGFVFWTFGIIFYYCWFQVFYNSLKYNTIFPYSDFSVAFRDIINNFIAISIIFILNYLTVFRIIKIKNLKYKIFLDIVLSFAFAITVNWLYITIHGLYRKAGVDWTGTILNNILILMVIELVYYFQNYNSSRVEIEMSARKALQYKYDALKAQINPHFLFNSLNLLSSLVCLDKEKSKQFIQGLASMYRYIMTCEGKETTSVIEELDFLSSYVRVLEMRYNNKFSVEMKGEGPLHAKIVPYTMQLLIENVTKHNVISSKYPMTVQIEILEEGIKVSNPIRERSATKGGIGLRYLVELYGIYGKEFSTTAEEGVFEAYVPYI